jgi:hypothetical protein
LFLTLLGSKITNSLSQSAKSSYAIFHFSIHDISAISFARYSEAGVENIIFSDIIFLVKINNFVY